MPSDIYILKDIFLEKQKEKNRTPATIKSIDERLVVFFRWFTGNYGITDAREITKKQITGYQDYLNAYRKKRGIPEGAACGNPLSASRKGYLVKTLLYWFKFLEKEEYILVNPGIDIEVAPDEIKLPGNILTEREVLLLLNAPDIRTPEGLRDRAILEMLYGSGLRNAELRNLKLSDIDMENSYLYVKGKGNKDRVIPMTKKSKRYLKEYLTKVRPGFVFRKSERNFKEETVFIRRGGNSLLGNRLTRMVRRYGIIAGITKITTPHGLRHACAAHLIERGANVRYVQELLGHSNINTTQIYTKVMPSTLKKVYDATHPRCL